MDAVVIAWLIVHFAEWIVAFVKIVFAALARRAEKAWNQMMRIMTMQLVDDVVCVKMKKKKIVRKGVDVHW
jgi:hypothetical protein